LVIPRVGLALNAHLGILRGAISRRAPSRRAGECAFSGGGVK
jgi:hypothetical protein